MMATRFEQRFEPVAEHSARFTDLLRSLTSKEASQRAPGLDWTAAEVGAHVLSVYRRYTVDTRRASTIAGLRAQNASDVADTGTDLRAIADGIDEQTTFLAQVAPKLDPAQLFQFRRSRVAATGSVRGRRALRVALPVRCRRRAPASR